MFLKILRGVALGALLRREYKVSLKITPFNDNNDKLFKGVYNHGVKINYKRDLGIKRDRFIGDTPASLKGARKNKRKRTIIDD